MGLQLPIRRFSRLYRRKGAVGSIQLFLLVGEEVGLMANHIFYFIEGVTSFIIIMCCAFLFVRYLQDKFDEVSIEVSWKGVKLSLKRRRKIHP